MEINKRKVRTLSLLGNSGAVGLAAVELTENNPDIVMVTSDLCFFSGLERYKNAFPDNLINVGIAEQNMVGVAGGMAKEGLIPFVGTYASFVSRCADQIRVNMSYMGLPIKFIGFSSGYATGILGATHMCIEDLAFMRALPGIDIISPADCTETVKAMFAVANTNRPAYIRLTGTMPTPIVYNEDYEFILGKAIEFRTGKEVCMIATGSMVYYSLQVANKLEEIGISASVINMHTIKPIDVDALDKANDNHKIIVVLEEHSIFGGLFGVVSEYLSQKMNHPILRAIGINDFFAKSGKYSYQMKESGLETNMIFEKIKLWYKEIVG